MSRAERRRAQGNLQAMEAALGVRDSERQLLRLYVNGASANAARAIVNVRRFCEAHLRGRYELEVIDVGERPELAEEANIIALPALVRRLPLPLRRFIGDMSEPAELLRALEVRRGGDLPPRADPPHHDAPHADAP